MSKSIGIFIGLVVLAATPLLGAESRVPTAVLSLEGGGWVVAADPKNVGREEAWWKAPVAGAKPVRVPGIFQEALPGYHGVAWYWREFESPVNPYQGGRCRIRFHAVDYLAHVWLNDVAVGGHEGAETPFLLDITDAMRTDGPNRLAVRVLNPTAERIDGMVLAEVPHRNKAASGISVGGSYNSGGIVGPVEVFWTPAVRIDDVYVRADWRSGAVRIQTTLFNTGANSVRAKAEFVITPASANEPVAALTVDEAVVPGSSQVECALQVPQHKLWRLEDPFLYRLTARVVAEGGPNVHVHSTGFGFRELRVEHGYFQLNGKRIFLKSSHTGNHCPVGAILPPDSAPDLLRKDLIYMKACGFNMVRFIAGMAYPYQLDLCDEIGLMVYEENLAAWLLADSPKMAERFDSSLREMVLRDRNHPSVVIFGLVNEMSNGPMVRHSVASLALLRSLDDSRLVLQQSGRWDGQFHIGSVSNPGSTRWEHVWGVESPDYQGTARNGPWGGYFEGAGDAHIYPVTPHTPAIEAGIRNLGRESKPVFLSEYGIGSLMNAIRERRFYEQHGANPDWDDFKYFKQTEEKLVADWQRFGMDGVYALPEEMLRASQRLHCRQRELGFSLIRSNPRICGYNLTGLLDHGYTGEGLWTFWREFKPGIMDTLQDGWAPLRWCLFASPIHSYVGRPVRLEVVLANEGALAPATYPVWLRVLGPEGIVWEKKTQVVVPQPDETGGPLAIPVFVEDIVLSGPPGVHTFAATMERGGAPAAGRLQFNLSAPPLAEKGLAVVAFALDERHRAWLEARGVSVQTMDEGDSNVRRPILVGSAISSITASDREELQRRVEQGSTAILLDPSVFRKGDESMGWFPLSNKGRLTHFSDWLYHKECVARKHDLFTGLTPPGIMDWDYYGPLISNRFFEGQDTPDDVAVAAFAICHSSRPDGYASGLVLGAYKLGQGRIILNTLNILENLDQHPAADRLLLNLVACAMGDLDWEGSLGEGE
ncbi:MAG: glycoside hydrolase family 2 protein [Verrucomicrobiia bacterium]